MSDELKGQCLCGDVQFTIERGDLEPPDACHCTQCRRFAGNYWTTVSTPITGLAFQQGENDVVWYRSSEVAKRGFCKTCGASLFYTADGIADRKHRMAVALGTLDQPTGLKLHEHIHVSDKGDYYDIADGLPQKAAD